jgi:RND family efflux transporter MFP subunit
MPRSIVVIAAVAWLSACGRQSSKPATSVAEAPPSPVRTIEVVAAPSAAVDVPGIVQARERATIVSRVAAAVVALPYREGDRVARGAVVARLDDGAMRAAVAAAETASRSAELDRRRLEALLARDAATPREVEEASARAAAAQAFLSASRENLAYAVLRAPFAGVVSARPAHVGDVALPGMPLVELEGDGGLEVKASVEARLAGSLRPGQEISARVDGVAQPITATVRAISPAAEESTHRVDVRADVPAAPGLRSGLFARLALPATQLDGRLLVPASSIVRRGGLAGVYVVAGGRPRLRWVRLGASEGDRVEVRAGLDAGERVAADPAGLQDGAGNP